MKQIFVAVAIAVMTTFSSATPNSTEALELLKAGNIRFVNEDMKHPHCSADRRLLAANTDQGKFAYATILSCSDSRVPVEQIFDAGIMDLFIVRVAGNVADTDEVGTIEYGVAHVNTPVVVVMGHTGCGAVKAVTAAIQGHGHPLEINIPPLVDNIAPAVEMAMKMKNDAMDDSVIPYAIEENVYQSIRDLFLKSPVTRRLAINGTLKVVGAVYDLASGVVAWLPDEKVSQILKSANVSPKRQTQEMAGGHESSASKTQDKKSETKAEHH